MNYANLLKEIWQAVYDPKNDTGEIIKKYFHENYKQCINGVSLQRTEYIAHVVEQKKNMTVEQIEYGNLLEKGNELFALYYPRARNTQGFPIEAEVIAYFQFEGQQIINIHGQVRLIKGDLSDVDMTS